MRVSRFITFLLIPVVLCFGSFVTTANDGPGSGSAAFPSLTSLVDYDSQTFYIEAYNPVPNAIALFQCVVTSQGASPSQSTLNVPFYFDATGRFSASWPLSTFATGDDFTILAQILTLDPTSTFVLQSEQWLLDSTNYVVGDPANPPPAHVRTSPGGGCAWQPIPGTQAPLFPFSHAAINLPQQLAIGTAMVQFDLGPGGPAGSFPIF